MRGNVAKRPNGQWRARYRDDLGKEHARHFSKKADAERWLNEITASRVIGQYVDPGIKITFDEFYRDWSRRQLWQQSTVVTMNLAVKGVPFGDLPFPKIKKSHVEAWVKAMVARGLAAHTVRSRFDHVARVIHAARDDRLTADDPTRGIRLPAVRRGEAAMTLPTSNQIAAIFETADEDFAVYVALCAFAGMRLGEAAAIQAADIDWPMRTIKVSRQVQRVNGGIEVRAPKYGSERVVFAPDGLLYMLGELIKRRGLSGDDFLFTGVGDDPPHQNVIWHRWRAACKRAGVEGITLHGLRHWFASGLIAAGADVVTVQRALGHASATVTLRVYSHLWPSGEDKTRNAAAGLMASVADSMRTDSLDSPSTEGKQAT